MRARAFVEIHERLQPPGSTVTIRFWTRDQNLALFAHSGATITILRPDGIAAVTDAAMTAGVHVGQSLYHYASSVDDMSGQYAVECKGTVDAEEAGTVVEKAVGWFEIHPRKQHLR